MTDLVPVLTDGPHEADTELLAGQLTQPALLGVQVRLHALLLTGLHAKCQMSFAKKVGNVKINKAKCLMDAACARMQQSMRMLEFFIFFYETSK